eukprot:375270-Pelagomonas_calceolata.AAC.7
MVEGQACQNVGCARLRAWEHIKSSIQGRVATRTYKVTPHNMTGHHTQGHHTQSQHTRQATARKVGTHSVTEDEGCKLAQEGGSKGHRGGGAHWSSSKVHVCRRGLWAIALP